MASITRGQGYAVADETFVSTTTLALPAQSVTATGNDGAPADLGTGRIARMNFTLASYAGITNITVNLDTSPDGVTWTNVGNTGALTANGTTRKVFSGLDRYVRFSWTVTGAGSVTVSATGDVL